MGNTDRSTRVYKPKLCEREWLHDEPVEFSQVHSVDECSATNLEVVSLSGMMRHIYCLIRNCFDLTLA